MLGEIAASRARLEHQQRTAEAASHGVHQRATPRDPSRLRARFRAGELQLRKAHYFDSYASRPGKSEDDPRQLITSLAATLPGGMSWEGTPFHLQAIDGRIRNGRLIDALMAQALSALGSSPGARAFYDAQRAAGTEHNAALRKLANRLVGILHGCLKTRTLYDESTAWSHRENKLAA